MHIRHKECSIRSATEHDGPLLCRWWNDGAVMEHAGFPDGLGVDVDAVVRIIKRNNTDTQLMIIEIDGVPVGELHYRSRDGETAEIGIKICDVAYQGQGYGPRFLRMLISYLFDERGYNKIVLDTNVQNERAQHVYEKLGFRETGRRIGTWRNQRGELQSVVDYELVRPSTPSPERPTPKPE